MIMLFEETLVWRFHVMMTVYNIVDDKGRFGMWIFRNRVKKEGYVFTWVKGRIVIRQTN